MSAAKPQQHQAAHSGSVGRNPFTRGLERAPFGVAFARPTPPCGG